MGRIGLAVRVFFGVLFQGQVAEQVRAAMSGETPVVLAPARLEVVAKPTAPKPPARSEAITLLATLQREARFVDFIQEPIASYSDAQIGAAVRDIHRDCGAVLKRLFALQPVVNDGEGAELTLPAGFDAGRFRLTGNVGDQSQPKGRVVHQGWEASQCELPLWTGGETAAKVIAPAEVEVG